MLQSLSFVFQGLLSCVRDSFIGFSAIQFVETYASQHSQYSVKLYIIIFSQNLGYGTTKLNQCLVRNLHDIYLLDLEMSGQFQFDFPFCDQKPSPRKSIIWRLGCADFVDFFRVEPCACLKMCSTKERILDTPNRS